MSTSAAERARAYRARHRERVRASAARRREAAARAAAALTDETPNLADAACIGQWDLFDPQREGEDRAAAEHRWQAAIGICRGCPELAPCGEWADQLPARKRPTGVVAGRLHEHPAAPAAGQPMKHQP